MKYLQLFSVSCIRMRVKKQLRKSRDVERGKGRGKVRGRWWVFVLRLVFFSKLSWLQEPSHPITNTIATTSVTVELSFIPRNLLSSGAPPSTSVLLYAPLCSFVILCTLLCSSVLFCAQQQLLNAASPHSQCCGCKLLAPTGVFSCHETL